jgi:hypothetical protein
MQVGSIACTAPNTISTSATSDRPPRSLKQAGRIHFPCDELKVMAKLTLRTEEIKEYQEMVIDNVLFLDKRTVNDGPPGRWFFP